MLASDDDILIKAQDWKAAGKGVAIATVVETWGSATAIFLAPSRAAASRARSSARRPT